MGRIASAQLYIERQDDDEVVIEEPVAPDDSVTVEVLVRIHVRLEADDLDTIEADGVRYDLRVRFLEADSSTWPWGDDTDDNLWEVRETLKGIPSETVEVREFPFIHKLKEAGSEYFAAITLYRWIEFGIGGGGGALDKRETNRIHLKYHR